MNRHLALALVLVVTGALAVVPAAGLAASSDTGSATNALASLVLAVGLALAFVGVVTAGMVALDRRQA